MTRAALITVTLAALVLGAAILLSGRDDRPSSPRGGAPAGHVLRPVPGSRLSAEQINRQDPPAPVRQRDEARAHDRRPLLSALPLTLHGVSFEIGGLAADDRTTIIHAAAHGLGRRQAQIAFQTLQRRTGDRSDSYRLQVTP